MGNRSYPKLVDGLESADDDGSVQGANRAISASLTADSIQKEPGKFVERTAWLFVIISCLDGLDSDLLFQLIKFFNYLHTFLDKPTLFLARRVFLQFCSFLLSLASQDEGCVEGSSPQASSFSFCFLISFRRESQRSSCPCLLCTD